MSMQDENGIDTTYGRHGFDLIHASLSNRRRRILKVSEWVFRKLFSDADSSDDTFDKGSY